MTRLSINLNKKEEELFREYSKLMKIPLSTLVKKALLERIEEDMDLRAILDYEKKLEEGDAQYISLEDVKKRLGM